VAVDTWQANFQASLQKVLAIGCAQVYFGIHSGIRRQLDITCSSLKLYGREETARPSDREQLLGSGAVTFGSRSCEFHIQSAIGGA
jgi:hypothetical protein